jgi:hypothetical protein
MSEEMEVWRRRIGASPNSVLDMETGNECVIVPRLDDALEFHVFIKDRAKRDSAPLTASLEFASSGGPTDLAPAGFEITDVGFMFRYDAPRGTAGTIDASFTYGLSTIGVTFAIER